MERRNLYQNQLEPDLPSGPEPNKKAYQKPEMIYLAPLEAMAAICALPGKVDLGSCSVTQS
jgi:hypothetical protein